MPTPKTIAEAFRQLDFHDQSFVGMRLLPAQRRGQASTSTIELQLLQYSQNTLRVLRFCGCANLRVAMDFDVLAGNLPPNTSHVEAYTKVGQICDLMESQKKDWGVEYAGEAGSPLTPKLASADELILFRVQFFGGVVDVVAREYQIEPASEHTHWTRR